MKIAEGWSRLWRVNQVSKENSRPQPSLTLRKTAAPGSFLREVLLLPLYCLLDSELAYVCELVHGGVKSVHLLRDLDVPGVQDSDLEAQGGTRDKETDFADRHG